MRNIFKPKRRLRVLDEEKSKALFESIERHIDGAFKTLGHIVNVFTTSAFSLLRFDLSSMSSFTHG